MQALVWLRIQLMRHRKRSRGYEYDPVANAFPRIWIGDGNRLTKQFMSSFNITHVLNCADDAACPSRIKSTLTPDRYTCLDAVDSLHVNIFKWYPKFKTAMDTYLRDPSCKGVYVHCQAGMNRSAFLAAAYIMRTFGVSFADCIQRIVSQRPCVMTNPAFQSQLIDFVHR
jgi:hypothetical protein